MRLALAALPALTLALVTPSAAGQDAPSERLGRGVTRITATCSIRGPSAAGDVVIRARRHEHRVTLEIHEGPVPLVETLSPADDGCGSVW